MGITDTLTDAAGSYYESEMERWEETKELGPSGTFARDFRYGLTGPATSLDSDGDLYHGPEPYSTVNTEAFEGISYSLYGEPDGAPDSFGYVIWAVLALIAVMVVSYTVGQLFTFEVGV